METYDVIVLGGGLSGICLCAEIQAKGEDCLLIEKEAKLGGLTRTRMPNGFVFDCHGGHIFNTKSERVKSWVFSFLPESKWKHSVRLAKIWYGNKLISYPFEFALGQLDAGEATECIMGMFERSGKEPKVFGEWLKWNFGVPIAEKYLLPYNRKIWKRDLSKISTHWVSGKMPIPEVKDVIYAALSGDDSEKKMVHSSYYYPKRGGIEGFTGCIISKLKNVMLNSPLMNIEKQRGMWIVNGSVRAKKLVSTIPVPELTECINRVPDKVRSSISRLEWNSITTVLCEQKKGENISWLYLPGDDLPSHRIVYQGCFARFNCPKGKFSACYEITGKQSPEKMLRPFRKPNLPRELKALEMIDYEHTEYAYPVYHLDFPKDIKVIQSWLEKTGILSIGRFAEWKYYNMDDCIGQALTVSDNLHNPKKNGYS